MAMCVSCGNDISNTADRRNICNKSAIAIASLWQHFLKIEFKKRNQLSLLDALFSKDGAIPTGQDGNQRNIYRKCFYLYKRWINQLIAMFTLIHKAKWVFQTISTNVTRIYSIIIGFTKQWCYWNN